MNKDDAKRLTLRVEIIMEDNDVFSELCNVLLEIIDDITEKEVKQ